MPIFSGWPISPLPPTWGVEFRRCVRQVWTERLQAHCLKGIHEELPHSYESFR